MPKKFNSPFRVDPSRTGMIVRAWGAELNRRFAKLQKAIWKLIVEEDAFGLKVSDPNRPIIQSRFKFLVKDAKVPAFQRWLKKQIADGIFEAHPGPGQSTSRSWLHTYIDSSYRKGAVRSYLAAHKRELGKPEAYYEGTQRQFLESAFNRPERVSKLRLLYTRAYEDLQGVTSQMASRMGSVLASGLAHGQGAMKIARDLSRVTSIARTRSRVIARTEIIHAHAEGQLDAMEDLGVEETKAEVEWHTAQDSGVCQKCKKMDGKVFKVAKSHGLIPLHPNCRCAWIPHVKLPSLGKT